MGLKWGLGINFLPDSLGPSLSISFPGWGWVGRGHCFMLVTGLYWESLPSLGSESSCLHLCWVSRRYNPRGLQPSARECYAHWVRKSGWDSPESGTSAPLLPETLGQRQPSAAFCLPGFPWAGEGEEKEVEQKQWGGKRGKNKEEDPPFTVSIICPWCPSGLFPEESVGMEG